MCIYICIQLTRYLHIHVLHAKVSHVSQLHVPTRWWLEAHSYVSWPARCKDGSLSLVCCFSHLDLVAGLPWKFRDPSGAHSQGGIGGGLQHSAVAMPSLTPFRSACSLGFH